MRALDHAAHWTTQRIKTENPLVTTNTHGSDPTIHYHWYTTRYGSCFPRHTLDASVHLFIRRSRKVSYMGWNPCLNCVSKVMDHIYIYIYFIPKNGKWQRTGYMFGSKAKVAQIYEPDWIENNVITIRPDLPTWPISSNQITAVQTDQRRSHQDLQLHNYIQISPRLNFLQAKYAWKQKETFRQKWCIQYQTTL